MKHNSMQKKYRASPELRTGSKLKQNMMVHEGFNNKIKKLKKNSSSEEDNSS